MLLNQILLFSFLPFNLCDGETVINRSGKPDKKRIIKFPMIRKIDPETKQGSKMKSTSTGTMKTTLKSHESTESTSESMGHKETIKTAAKDDINQTIATSLSGREASGEYRKNFVPPIPRLIREREEHAGGFNCYPKWYPYFAYISRLTAGYCAGTLLSSEYVLTAGHCCYGHEISGVYAGYFHDRNTWDQYAEPVNVIVHGQYDNDTFQYDACIIKVKRFEESSVIKFVNLNTKYTINSQIFSVGYATNRSMYTKEFLHLGTMPCIENRILSEEECKQRMRTNAIDVNYYDPESMICTEPIYRRSERKMEADAGGPLIKSNRQIGISSFVLATKDGVGLSFHAQVDAVYPFIKVYMEQLKATGAETVPVISPLLLSFTLYFSIQ